MLDGLDKTAEFEIASILQYELFNAAAWFIIISNLYM